VAGKWAPWLAVALLAAWTALLYARVAGYPFLLFDDNRYLTENPQVKAGLTWGGVAWAFTTLHASNWHPSPGSRTCWTSGCSGWTRGRTTW